MVIVFFSWITIFDGETKQKIFYEEEYLKNIKNCIFIEDNNLSNTYFGNLFVIKYVDTWGEEKEYNLIKYDLFTGNKTIILELNNSLNFYDLKDFNNDGILDIISGTGDGYIRIFNSKTFETIFLKYLGKSIKDIIPVDIDNDSIDEYVISTTKYDDYYERYEFGIETLILDSNFNLIKEF